MKKAAVFFLLLFIAAMSACSDSVSEKTEKTAEELLDVVASSVKFPPTTRLTDEERIAEMNIDFSNAEEYVIVQQLVSVDVVEVIIIKAEKGQEDILSDLEKRKESLINDFAYYPEQVESAEATVVGRAKDVCYLICHAEASEAEKALKAAV